MFLQQSPEDFLSASAFLFMLKQKHTIGILWCWKRLENFSLLFNFFFLIERLKYEICSQLWMCTLTCYKRQDWSLALLLFFLFVFVISSHSPFTMSTHLSFLHSVTGPIIERVVKCRWQNNIIQLFYSLPMDPHYQGSGARSGVIFSVQPSSLWSMSEISSIDPFTSIVGEFCAVCAGKARHLLWSAGGHRCLCSTGHKQ